MASGQTIQVKFSNPPVVESIFGVQFPSLALTSGHLGWFWKSKMGDEWPKAVDAPPLPDQFERFGEDRWMPSPSPPSPVALIRPGSARLQLINAADDRVIQVQKSRFYFNWRKRDRVYPSYERTRDEFLHAYGKFSEFVREAQLGDVAPSQWELSYIDHVEKGALWQSHSDWHKVIPGLFPTVPALSGLRFESAEEWHYEIEPRRGRLHITIQHGLTESKTELLILIWTARGPIQGTPLKDSLDFGHDAILRAFLGLTSAEAQRAWGRS